MISEVVVIVEKSGDSHISPILYDDVLYYLLDDSFLKCYTTAEIYQ